MTREEIARGLRCSASTGEKDCGKCHWGIREEFEGGVWESCDCDRMAVEAADLLENDGSQILALQRELALRQAQLDCAAASSAVLKKQNEQMRDAAADVTRLAAEAAVERDWISVEDRLPEPMTWVLCACRDGRMRILRYDNIMDDWDLMTRNTCYRREHVKYWMPLPAVPEEGEHG